MVAAPVSAVDLILIGEHWQYLIGRRRPAPKSSLAYVEWIVRQVW